MNPSSIHALSDPELMLALKNSVTEERKQTALVLEYLREVDRRRLYAESGHSSLWDFCVHELGYSEAAAGRRIASMRLIREMPELRNDLIEGRQNLSSLAQAQRFFKIEEKHQAAKLTTQQKREVIGKLEGKSSRECEKALLDLSSAPIAMTKPERERVVDEAHTELKLVLDRELLAMLKRIRELRSHANPSLSYVELLKFMAADVLKRLDPLEKAKARAAPHETPTSESGKSAAPTSFRRMSIPAAIRRAIWLRDQGKCGYVDPSTGKKCESKYFLEIDHVAPVALGGNNDLSNLRLRCRSHNAREAVRIFGAQALEVRKTPGF